MSGAAAPSDPGVPGDEGYESWVGRVIDSRYRIERLLGEGGMGAVFLAEHLKLAKRVALKVILPEFAGDGEIAERFVREAMASASVDHPNIASAVDYGTLAEGGGYLVMQFARGTSLRELLDDGPLPWVRACDIALQVTDALEAAHREGIVHRDLKPDNVMVEPRDDGSCLVRVLDFGVARVPDQLGAAAAPALTKIGTVIGTPGYMAPEQALGEVVDGRADLYALGLLLYEMLVGDPLYDDLELTAIVTRQLTEPAPRPSEACDRDWPEALDLVVKRLLARERDSRPANAAELRESLRGLLIDATLQAATSGERSVPALGSTELAAMARRDPTPLGLARPAPAEVPSVAVAPTALGMAPAVAPKVTSWREPLEGLGIPLPLLAVGGSVVGLLAALGIAVALMGSSDEATAEVPEWRKGAMAPIAPPVAEATEQAEEEPPPRPTKRARRGPPPVPQDLGEAFATLMTGDRQVDRRRAAAEILEHEPEEEVPELMRAVATLERSRNCRTMRTQIETLGELGDPRALPVLERVDRLPRNTCGNIFRRGDCFSCLRGPLAETLEALRAEIR